MCVYEATICAPPQLFRLVQGCVVFFFGDIWLPQFFLQRMSFDISGTSWDQRVSMVPCSFTSTETRRLVRTDSPGRPPRLYTAPELCFLSKTLTAFITHVTGTDKRRFPQRIWLPSALVCPSRSSGAVVVRDVMKDALKQLNVPESVERVNWVAFGWLLFFFFFKCCFTSTETVRTVRDGKLRTSGGSLRLSHSSWALRSVSVLLYVHRDRRDEKLRTSTSSFTQVLSSEVHFIVALTLVTTTETVGTVGTGSPRRPPRLSHRS